MRAEVIIGDEDMWEKSERKREDQEREKERELQTDLPDSMEEEKCVLK